MRVWFFLTALCLAGACSGSTATASDAGTADAATATPDAALPDGGARTSCLDRPGELLRPPAGRLPCELFPPDVRTSPTLKR